MSEKRDREAGIFSEQCVNFCCGTMLIKLSPTEVVRTASKMSYSAGYDSGYSQGADDAFRKVCEHIKDCGVIASEDTYSIFYYLKGKREEILKG